LAEHLQHSRRIGWPALRARLVHAYDQSVVRRTFLFGAFLVPAFFATSAMFYGAALLLAPADFGILYLAHAIQNVVCAGSVILNIFLTRHYTLLDLRIGPGATAASARAVERIALYTGPPGVLALAVAMAVGGQQIGAHSWALALLVPMDIFGSYLCDLERAALQSAQKTIRVGLFNLLQMALRAMLSLAGIFFFGTVWAAIIGWIAASAVLYLGFRSWVLGRQMSPGDVRAEPPSLSGILPLMAGYAIVMGVCYLDVIIAYLALPSDTFGLYSASSVLPKMILIGLTPIMLMLFPLMIGQNIQVPPVLVRRIALVLAALTGAAALGLVFASPFLCEGGWGLRYCQGDAFGDMMLSLVPLVLLRLLVFVAFATARDWLPLSIFIPVAVFAAQFALGGAAPSAAQLARDFAIFAAATLGFFWLVLRISQKRRG
jgi:hypothetical protein